MEQTMPFKCNVCICNTKYLQIRISIIYNIINTWNSGNSTF